MVLGLAVTCARTCPVGPRPSTRPRFFPTSFADLVSMRPMPLPAAARRSESPGSLPMAPETLNPPPRTGPTASMLLMAVATEALGAAEMLLKADSSFCAVAEAGLAGTLRARGMRATATLGATSLGAISLGSGLAFFFSRAAGGAGGSSSISLSAMRAKRPSLLSTMYSRRTRLVRPMVANTTKWTSTEMPPIHAIDLVSLRRRGAMGRGVAAGTR